MLTAQFDKTVVNTTFETNFFGTRELIIHLLPLIKAHGKIINVTSMAGKFEVVSPELKKRYRYLKGF